MDAIALPNYHILHVNQKGNQTAHWVAKFALAGYFSILSEASLHPELARIFNADAMQIGFPRKGL